MNNDSHLSNERYLAALKRIRALIAEGEVLSFYDCDDPGDKSSACSWGLCSESMKAWPDAEDHLWPDQFLTRGRIAPKYRQTHQYCPMSLGRKGWGCFYTCHVFQGREPPSREEALAFYDEAIKEFEEQV